MVRAPCCEKMGLKKGPWTPEEDQILITHIQTYGHGNWRALPKQAGLLRCGKSCRLRWTNYLRPDIKRGNFTREEEDTIIELHELLGNRWSAIAARLPGRTDNEIKNVWHTHLKKRLNKHNPEIKKTSIDTSKFSQESRIDIVTEQESVNLPNLGASKGRDLRPISPQQSSSDISSSVTTVDACNNVCMKIESSRGFPEVDESFWSEVLSSDNSVAATNFPAVGSGPQAQIPFCSVVNTMEPVHGSNSNMYDCMDFWYNLFTGGGELPELSEF